MYACRWELFLSEFGNDTRNVLGMIAGVRAQIGGSRRKTNSSPLNTAHMAPGPCQGSLEKQIIFRERPSLPVDASLPRGDEQPRFDRRSPVARCRMA